MDETTMYCNKFTVTMNDSEAFVRFQWVTPIYDANDKLVGNTIIDQRNITFSRSALLALAATIEQVKVQADLDEKKKQA